MHTPRQKTSFFR